MYPATPAYLGDYAARFAALGVNVMGGCCGTTPAHIAAMRAALDDPARIDAAAALVPAWPIATEATPTILASEEPPSALARRLSDPDAFVTARLRWIRRAAPTRTRCWRARAC